MSSFDLLLDGTPSFCLDFLLGEYRAAMQQRNDENTAAAAKRGEPPLLIDIDAELDKLRIFINFSRDFLTKHRPVELFYPDANFGIKLSNGQQFTVAPLAENIRGSMQVSRYAPITGVRYADEVAGGNSHAITGQPRQAPAGTTDMTIPRPAVDKTQTTGPIHYDK